MKQARAFLTGEGDCYHERNRDKGVNQRVIDAILDLGIKPSSILEIGCGDGRYLNVFQRVFGARCTGIDPSAKAIADGKKNYPDISLYHSTADQELEIEVGYGNRYDLIIFGFCLYLMDREDLFYAVALSDTLLKVGGTLAIHDFRHYGMPKITVYKHRVGIYTYKMWYPKLWLANPTYIFDSEKDTSDDSQITFLRKRTWEEACAS